MKYAVLSRYCGATVILDVFSTEDEASFFASEPYIIDSTCTCLPNEMWIEPYEDIPFNDYPNPEEVSEVVYTEEELPF